ncbi:DUF805 domain-containing protein [Labrenzia sp. PHM005]|uniref:DUF805 domain-containing protein n=1 Tax=Labrenzia sp. PHM005 TaxID=2590016 RepID=UPI00113FEE73|nr:DUF805 domain-containing protein [Labrenzia sp. PHM005]QDG74804.1 DUF805 domain-containing protein [Labrenzia sp. PHM005]
MNHYFDAMRLSFTFKGRSTRAQFWSFVLVVTLLLILTSVIDAAIDPTTQQPPVVTGLALLIHYVPMLSISVRRLHDTNRSGWWLLIGFVPLGLIVLLVFYCLPSNPASNRFNLTQKATA